jgi:hypothetical protein
MISQADILQWKRTGEDYDTGIRILEHAISQGFKCALFPVIARAKSSFSEKLLIQEIDKAFSTIIPATLVISNAAKKVGAIDVSNFPIDLQELYRKTIENLKEMDALKGSLVELFYDENGNPKRFADERRAHHVATQIHRLWMKNQENWARLDYYRDEGKYLPGTEPKELSVERLIYLLQHVVKMTDYLSKARRKIKKGEKVNIKTYKEYEEMEHEIKTIINGKV